VDRDRDNPLGFGTNTYAAATINSCCQESTPSVPITPAPAPSSPPSIQEQEQKKKKEGKDKIVPKEEFSSQTTPANKMRTQLSIGIFNSTMTGYWI
jgi:hypothetical protein